ncbi:RING-finger domain-containing protein [Mycena sanguinolenta]|uniref:RING-finger domain-containing protein n=1 Tax=Mycena sanguinolenta TaxID=230812 RepID=A0A8H6YMW8_9AGAR|nr:RING-finger domain-containing protein [Mycena sanguinolenta]
MSGLPLLSGPPPVTEGTDPQACRKCSKEFNFLLTRARRCNHCGYSYCHSCTDFQGLMPRPNSSGNGTGYDMMHVCGYCIEFLGMTASGRGQLRSLVWTRSLPLAKLKKYISAYNIRADRAVEKDDLIDAILAAKGPNGCLSPANENYYRQYSVPDRSAGTRSRGIFSRSSAQAPSQPPPPPRPNQAPAYEFPRPDLTPDEPRYAPPPGQRPQSPPRRPASQPQTQPRHASAPHPSMQYRHPHDGYHSQTHFNSHLPPRHPGPPPAAPHATRPQQQQPNAGPYQNPRPSRSTHNLNANAQNARTPPPRARAASAAPPPNVPPPTLAQLLAMSEESLRALSVHMLKEILFTNHVAPGVVLEKSDLVKKVQDLLDEERRQRERRQRLAEEAEEQARIEQQRVMMEQFARQQKEREDREKAAASAAAGDTPAEGRESGPTPSASAPPPLPPKAQAMASHLERTGLCVICQDEEANIAIVDCGHLAMCRDCSDLVMGSSRECPLCRTRIVTEARLLRIFKS